MEDLLDVRFDGSFGDEQTVGDGLVGEPFGDQGEHLAFPFGELAEGVGAAPAGEEPGDDRGVDNGLAVGDTNRAPVENLGPAAGLPPAAGQRLRAQMTYSGRRESNHSPVEPPILQ